MEKRERGVEVDRRGGGRAKNIANMNPSLERRILDRAHSEPGAVLWRVDRSMAIAQMREI